MTPALIRAGATGSSKVGMFRKMTGAGPYAGLYKCHPDDTAARISDACLCGSPHGPCAYHAARA